MTGQPRTVKEGTVHRGVHPLGGELDLNRDNLIVICGPRLSSVVRQVLQGDPAFGFGQDEAGRWLLQDRRTGQRYPSPSNPSTTTAR